MSLSFPTFIAGLMLSVSLIMAIGPQNAHVLRMGLQRQHLWLTVAICAIADMLLIGLGVLGLAHLGGLTDKIHGAMVGAGMLFLAVYGWQAFQRFIHPAAPTQAPAPKGTDAHDAKCNVSALPTCPQTEPISRRQAIGSALAFSWLNPHAWIDTAVLIGTASLAYGQGSTSFGLGAAAGSVLWFLALGGATFWLGRRLNSLRLWRALDGVVALMMWGTVVGLALSLV